MKHFLFLTMFLFSFGAWAQQDLEQFVHGLDDGSQRELQALLKDIDLRSIDFEVQEKNESVLVNLDVKQGAPKNEDRKQLLLLLGAGVGLVNTYGVNATVLRKNAEGRLTWFAQGEASYFKLGNYPADIQVGFGVFPFRKPVVGLAMAIHKSSYSSTLALGPELSFQKFFGQKQNLSIYSKVGAAYYHGERNASGQNFSILPDIKFGVAIKIFQTHK